MKDLMQEDELEDWSDGVRNLMAFDFALISACLGYPSPEWFEKFDIRYEWYFQNGLTFTSPLQPS